MRSARPSDQDIQRGRDFQAPLSDNRRRLTVSNFRRLDRGALIGVFDVTLIAVGMTIRGAKLFAKDGRRWIGMPDREWTTRDGARRFEPVVEIADRGAADRFRDQVLDALAEAGLVTGRAGGPVA